MLRCKPERGNREQGDRIEVTRFHSRVIASRLARLVLLYVETSLPSVKAEAYPDSLHKRAVFRLTRTSLVRMGIVALLTEKVFSFSKFDGQPDQLRQL